MPSPVVRHRQVVLLGNVDGFGHQQFLDFKAFRTGLGRHHAIAQHEVGGFLSLVLGLHQLDEASLSTATGMHLGLDHDQLASGRKYRLSGGDRLFNGGCNRTLGHGDAGCGKNVAGLMLMNLHVVLLMWVRDSTARRGR